MSNSDPETPTHVSQLVDRINVALESYTRFSEGCPQHLKDAIRYGLLGPGKRLRPQLAIWAAEACGGSEETAMPAACAVEMVHAYSLIHDDLPAMDDDDLRRGRPTCHKVFGESTAILAGDSLLALAFEVLARDVQPTELAGRCCAELAKAAGPTELVGGQADDLAAEAGLQSHQGAPPQAARVHQTLPDIETLQSIHARKTGAMFRVSLRLGGVVAAAEEVQLDALEEYGRSFGLAFQITDDLLDVAGREEIVGKRVGKDAQHGKMTFPALLGVEESRRRAEVLLDQACRSAQIFGEAAKPLKDLAAYILARNR